MSYPTCLTGSVEGPLLDGGHCLDGSTQTLRVFPQRYRVRLKPGTREVALLLKKYQDAKQLVSLFGCWDTEGECPFVEVADLGDPKEYLAKLEACFASATSEAR